MKASIYQQYGSPEVLLETSISIPTVAENTVLVQIHASTVNRTDCGFLRAKPAIVRLFSGLRKPKWPVLGCEFAGEVVATGEHVSQYAIGDRVIGYKDDDYGFGGHAQFTTIPVDAMLARIPEHMSFVQAAPAFEGAHYALHYIRAANIESGKRVLINGATGAIGSAAVQIIHDIGAHVTAVCSTEHIGQVKNLGADRVIDYLAQDFTQLEEKFDVVFDAVGKSTFGKCRALLNEDGFYASTELGPGFQNPLLALWTAWFGKQRVLFPIPSNSNADALYIASMMERGKFRPLIDRIYPLADVADAFRYVETGMKTGNVVIAIDDAAI